MASTRAPKSTVSEKTRAETERLRKELENADINKFKRLLKPLMPTIAPTKKKTG